MNIPSGTYTVGVIIDRLNEIPGETNKANNTAWVSSRKLYIGVRPTQADNWSLYR
jgi:hypothetical protein